MLKPFEGGTGCSSAFVVGEGGEQRQLLRLLSPLFSCSPSHGHTSPVVSVSCALFCRKTPPPYSPSLLARLQLSRHATRPLLLLHVRVISKNLMTL